MFPWKCSFSPLNIEPCVSPNSSTSTISSLQIWEQVLSSNSLPLLKCLHSTHSLLRRETKQNNKQHLWSPLLFTSVDKGRNGAMRRLTSSWCRRPGRWDTCHMWPHKHQAGCTRRPRTHTGPCRCTISPGWTCKCQCALSSCSSHPANPAHTDRSHNYRRHGLEDKKRHRLTHSFFFLFDRRLHLVMRSTQCARGKTRVWLDLEKREERVVSGWHYFSGCASFVLNIKHANKTPVLTLSKFNCF